MAATPTPPDPRIAARPRVSFPAPQGPHHSHGERQCVAWEATMEMDKELEEYARECTRLASLTDDPTIREPLLKMAREWMEVARAERQRASRAKIRPQWSASASPSRTP